MTDSQTFGDEISAFILEYGKDKTLVKGDFLLREGEVERNVYLVCSGAVRAFYLTEFEEHTVRLGYDGSVINSLSSYLTGNASEFYIEAIRKTELKFITKDEMNGLIYKDNRSLIKYNSLLELLFAQQIDREIDLLITSPSERLSRVLERSPHLFQHIPLKYIASYLRMKPETLSRIRNS